MAARGLVIRADVVTPAELRRRAKKEPRRRTAHRMLALASGWARHPCRAWCGASGYQSRRLGPCTLSVRPRPLRRSPKGACLCREGGG